MSEILQEYIVAVIQEEKHLMSEGLQFHIDENLPISLNIYRPGSKEYFNLFIEARNLYREGKIKLNHEIDSFYINELEIGEWGNFNGKKVPLDYPFLIEEEESIYGLNEAIYKGKKVKLGKAGIKRAGKGRSAVFVNTGKKNKDGSARIKKVTFGSSMPMAMGKSEAHRKRRKSFGNRHQCHLKKDKTKAGYWSCRATKLHGRNISGWW